jgi:Cohesin domain
VDGMRGSTKALTPMRVSTLIPPLLSSLLWCVSASAGTVAVEAPTVESNRYVFPIAIGADASGAASLDFQLRYDPEVFTPVSVDLGPAALAAGKVVEGNADAPGSYRVLVMGLNQNSLPPGQVAQVVFERNVDATATSSQVSLESPTLADASGAVLPSNGSQQDVVFDRADSPSEDPPADKPDDAEEEAPPVEAPETPAPADTPATGGSTTPLPGNVAKQVADVMLAQLSDANRNEREAANGNKPVPKENPARVPEGATWVASQEEQMNTAPPAAQPGPETRSENEIQLKQSTPAQAATPATPEVATSGQADSTAMAAQTVETKANVTILAAGGDGGALQGGRTASPMQWLIPLGLAAAGMVLATVWWRRRSSR